MNITFNKPNYKIKSIFIKEKEKEKFFPSLSNEYLNTNLSTRKEKINLESSSFTFLIPFHCDSIERIENLIIVLTNLERSVNKPNICLIECDKKRKLNITNLGKFLFLENFHYYFLPSQNFIKSKVINYAVDNYINTEWFCIQDTDVLISNRQFSFVKKYSQDKNFDVIIPSNGLFIDISKNEKLNLIKQDINFDFLEKNCKYVFEKGFYIGTGGIVFFRTDKFLEIGKMNENIVLWGFEDDELIYRYVYLGYNIIRNNYGRPLFHIWHPPSLKTGGRVINESRKSEYLKIKNMNHSELWNYIKSWKWNNYKYD